MARIGKRRSFLRSAALVAGFGALILALAVFQYRWSGEASRAEAVRIKDTLRATTLSMVIDFERELSILGDILVPLQSFHPETDREDRDSAYPEADLAASRTDDPGPYFVPGANDSLAAIESRVTEAFSFWRENAMDASLVEAVWLVTEKAASRGGAAAFTYEKYSSGGSWSAIGPKAVPFDLESIIADQGLAGQSATGAASRAGPDAAPEARRGDPFLLAQTIGSSPARILIVDIDRERVRSALLPALVEKYFGPKGRAYNVRVVERDSEALVYENFPARRGLAAAEPDLRLSLLSERFDPFLAFGAIRTGDAGERAPTASAIILSAPNVRTWILAGGRAAGRARGDRALFAADRGLWRIEVRHLGGSVDAYTGRMRWLNLGGSLILLFALSLGLLYLFRQYERSRSIVRAQGDFVASVSHELKTPLAVIKAAAENLMEGVVSGPEQSRRYGERMADEAERLLSLTENVLTYAGLDGDADSRAADQLRQGFEEVDLSGAAREAVRSSAHAAAQAGAHVDFEIDGQGPFDALGDRRAVESLVRNLVSNAIKHGMPEKGERRVLVRVARRTLRSAGRRKSLGPAYARARGKKGDSEAIVVSVKDWGPGVPKKYRERIFDPFFRMEGAAPGGVGLGLSLVRRIALVHGAAVALESHQGQGALFVAAFPPLAAFPPVARGGA